METAASVNRDGFLVKMAEMLAAGSIVECERGSYRLQNRIQTGGMGVVWEAESITSKRRVIVKEPLLNGDGDQIKIDRLIAESSILRNLNEELSPGSKNQQAIYQHVVRYLDETTDSTHPLLVLEFVDGPSLGIICKGRPFPEKIVIQHFTNLLNAVVMLHERGIIHRDLSPSNLILNPMRGIVLIDFGTSILVDPREKAGLLRSRRVVFKDGYSAPELLDGLSDQRSDVFSLGATLFFLLTGRNPLEFTPRREKGLTKSPHQIDSRVSEQISEIVQRALSPDYEKRFPSAAAMLQAVGHAPLERTSKKQTLTIGGVIYELTPEYVDIGREHLCDRACRSLGYERPPEIQIPDPQKFIEKHHARILVDRSGKCMLKDLRSVNHTALRRRKDKAFRILGDSEETLEDGDELALVYKPEKGPYVTLAFRAKNV